MIISHKHRFIFIKTAKTASTSVEIALSKICGDEDIITPIDEQDEEVRIKLTGRSAQNFHIPLKNFRQPIDFFRWIKNNQLPRFYQHSNVKYIKNHVSKNIWNNYYKFCVVRNPYERFVSFYNWAGGDQKYGSISNFLKTPRAKKLVDHEMYTLQNQIMVDHLCRFESLQNELNTISIQLGLDETAISLPEYKAKSGYKPPNKAVSEYLLPEVIDWVQANYDYEIKQFSYKPPI